MNCIYLIWIFKRILNFLIDDLILPRTSSVAKAWCVKDHKWWISICSLYKILVHILSYGLSLVACPFIYERVTIVVLSLRTKAVSN